MSEGSVGRIWSFLASSARLDVRDGAISLRQGALLWGLYALIHVAYAGVVLDESVLPAQIINGATSYPPGHPHEVFYWRALSLSHYLSALIWAVVPDPDFVSAIRNWMFLFASAYAVYTLTWLLTRRPLWAHTAVVLALLGAHLPFAGVYPMWTFPNYYSNGHLGLQLGLITVALFVAGSRAAPAFFLGLLPTIHGTLAVPVWVWAAAFLGSRHGPIASVRFLGWPLAAGLALSAAVGVATQVLPPDWIPTEPFVGEGDPSAIRETFRQMTDVHRGPYLFADSGYLGNLASLLGLGVVLVALWREPSGQEDDAEKAAARAAFVWLAAFAAICWAIVLGAWLAEAAHLLPNIAHLVMPGRFSNYSAVLLLPMTVAVAFAAVSRAPVVDRFWCWLGIAAGVLLASAFRFRLGTGAQAEIAHWSILFVGIGASFGIAFLFAPRARRLIAATAALVGLAFAFIGGNGRPALFFLTATGLAVGGVALARWASRSMAGRLAGWGVAAQATAAISMAVAAAVTLPGRTYDRGERASIRWDRTSPEDERIRAWLQKNAQPEELVLPALLPRAELQVKTGHPVLLELETLFIMTYMPSLAPGIARMTRDLYGVDYSRPEVASSLCGDGRVSMYCPVWRDVWRERDEREWRSLSRVYGFRLVVSPSDVSLPLERVVEGERFVLYRITQETPGAQISR